MSRYRADDVELLLPSFRPVAKELLRRMSAWGFKPIPFDTARTPAEAARNAAKGTGSARSVHLYGAAMDVICDEHGWMCASRGCDFYENLGREAEGLGLVWGGRWPKRDMPPTQCIPISAQNKMRSLGMGADSLDARDALAAKHIRPLAVK